MCAHRGRAYVILTHVKYNVGRNYLTWPEEGVPDVSIAVAFILYSSHRFVNQPPPAQLAHSVTGDGCFWGVLHFFMTLFKIELLFVKIDLHMSVFFSNFVSIF